MSYLITWNPCIHSPSIITMLFLMGLSIHILGECRGREQSRIGILIRPIHCSSILFFFVSQTFWTVATTATGLTEELQEVQMTGQAFIKVLDSKYISKREAFLRQVQQSRVSHTKHRVFNRVLTKVLKGLKSIFLYLRP